MGIKFIMFRRTLGPSETSWARFSHTQMMRVITSNDTVHTRLGEVGTGSVAANEALLCQKFEPRRGVLSNCDHGKLPMP